MSDTKSEAPLAAGPYTLTETRTFKISGPIEISFTRKIDSSHVPPAPAPSAFADLGDRVVEQLKPYIMMVLQKVNDLGDPDLEGGAGGQDQEH